MDTPDGFGTLLMTLDGPHARVRRPSCHIPPTRAGRHIRGLTGRKTLSLMFRLSAAIYCDSWNFLEPMAP